MWWFNPSRISCAAGLLIAVVSTAIASTKVPILLEHGFWKMAHEGRNDYAMFLLLIYLLIVGSGHLSLDRILAKRLSDRGNV